MALTTNGNLIKNYKMDKLWENNIKWFWIDFDSPQEEEVKILKEKFNFHYLSIEDCLHFLERPKVDFYENYNFFVLHALNHDTLSPEEIDIFLGENYIVTFHLLPSKELNEIWDKVLQEKTINTRNHVYLGYLIMDKIVDEYFPAVHRIEDNLNALDSLARTEPISQMINDLFAIRSDLLKLRRIISSMRDLLYRILNSTHLEGFKDNKYHFANIYDHLLKLSEMIEANREITSDIRDSYLSINSDRMNRIMMFLTVITSIFIPLTFIAGIYGMNFKYMPELEWRYGYFIVLFVMAIIGVCMYYLFKVKGWFDIFK